MSKLSRFRRDDTGSVSVIFAIAFIPLALGVCAAVELAQAYMIRERVDLALSAAAKALAQGGEEAEVMAHSVFDGYAEHLERRARTELVITEAGDKSALTARTTIETPFLATFGISELDLTSSRVQQRSGD